METANIQAIFKCNFVVKVEAQLAEEPGWNSVSSFCFKMREITSCLCTNGII